MTVSGTVKKKKFKMMKSFNVMKIFKKISFKIRNKQRRTKRRMNQTETTPAQLRLS